MSGSAEILIWNQLCQSSIFSSKTPSADDCSFFLEKIHLIQNQTHWSGKVERRREKLTNIKRVGLEAETTRGSESEKSLWKDLERVFQSILACSVNSLHYYYTTYLPQSIQVVVPSDGTVKENKGNIQQLRARTNGE